MLRRRIRDLKNNQSGFTLIELLIVIVILGILAAVVVFAVSAFNKNGQQAACQSDFKSVEIADEAFFAKTGGYAAANSTGPMGPLVPTYLREAPAINDNYTISLVGGGASVSVPNATTPTAPWVLTDSSACSHVSQ